MAEFVERSPAGLGTSSQAVDTEAKVAKIHPRQLLHAGIAFVCLLLYLWPGAVFVNSVEPRVLGLPLYVFWVVLLLPAVNLVNLLLYARFMVERERELKARNLEPWE